MSTDRSTFGLNSILPTGYMSKAEAFAKCLQDKLRSLGSGEEPPRGPNGRLAPQESPKTPHGSLTKFSEEEIAENVFLQGPLSYKRRSIPDQDNRQYPNGKSRGKYIGSLVDKRGMSSDSEDSEVEELASTGVHPRVAKLQGAGGAIRRLTSVNSVDSASSWCSCDEGPEPEEDVEVMDTLAAQIKGSPPIHNPRMRNFKRKSREEKLKLERPPPPPPDADLFFDFDVECFSPVNLEEDGEYINGFQSTQLRLHEESKNPWSSDFPESVDDTGQICKIVRNTPKQELIPYKENAVFITPPSSSSPTNGTSIPEKIQPVDESSDLKKVQESRADFEVSLNLEEGHNVDIGDLKENDSSSSPEHTMKQSLETESQPEPQEDDTSEADKQLDQEEDECNENDCHYDIVIETKDSGICSCDETSSRTGDEDISEMMDSCHITDEEATSKDEEKEKISGPNGEESSGTETQVDGLTDNVYNGVAPVMVLCDGVEIDESYLPSPRMKLRRCSSLKTWKTPPGTPGRKKIVRFADALGLDLADVRMFLDEVPKIPNSAFEDLHYDLPAPAPPPPVERTLIPMFQQPGTHMDFLQRVRQNNVSLESAVLTDVSLLSICGIVRVRNLSFHKAVHVRYSKDGWATFSDLQATFVPNSSDGFCDNFSFTLYGHTLNIGDRLEFAIRYDCAPGQFWDNNGGSNYVFQCMPRISSTTLLFPPLGSSPVDTWNKFY